MKDPNQYLQDQLRKKATNQPHLSVRAMARLIGMSPSFLSEILSGAKPVPAKRIDDFVTFFEMDELAADAFRKSVAHQLIRKGAVRTNLDLADPRSRETQNLPNLDSWESSGVEAFSESTRNADVLLEQWYYVAVLDLVTCREFSEDPIWISRRLGLSKADASHALQVLKANGLIEKNENGRYVKQTHRLRFSVTKTSPLIREFHQQMLRQASENLKLKITQEDFEARLISGITLAVNPEKLVQARKLINDAIHAATALLTEGECSEVYQLNLQLFPLTRK